MHASSLARGAMPPSTFAVSSYIWALFSLQEACKSPNLLMNPHFRILLRIYNSAMERHSRRIYFAHSHSDTASAPYGLEVTMQSVGRREATNAIS